MADMTIPSIILFVAMAIGLSQLPKVFKDLWEEVKEIYNIN